MSELEDLRAENARLSRRVETLEADLADRPHMNRATLYALVDTSPLMVGAIAADASAEYVSAAFKPWLAPGSEDATSFLDRLTPALRDATAPLLEKALAGAPGSVQATLANRDGQPRDLTLLVRPRLDSTGTVNGAIWVGQDNTEERLATEALADSEARLRLIVDGAGVGAYDTDLATGVAVWSPSTFEMLGLRPATHGRGGPDVWEARVHPADRERVETVRSAAMVAGGAWQVTYRIIRADTGEVRWLTSYGRVIPRPDRAPRSVGMIVDVTNEKQAEERQRLLLNELNHRVKNTLAAVQSIARSTLRGQATAEAASDLFNARLMALSAAHDVLTRETWEGAGLRDIVAGSIRAYDDASSSRFIIEGADVRLAPGEAVALALALHELAINAAKYGALSNDTGQVILRWEARGGGEARRLELEWREVGGPPVVKPSRTGFGSRLLRQGLKIELGASARIAFEPTGVVCIIEAPLIAVEAMEPA